MNSHAVFAPSAAERWLKCPPSARLTAGLPRRSNAAADEGTRVHEVIARFFKLGDVPLKPPSFIKQEGWSDYDIVAYLSQLVASLGAGGLLVEQHVVIEKGCWGTLDFAHIGKDVITILDYKNGTWDVPAINNKQLMTYAAGLLDGYAHQYFRLMIFQPNSWSTDEILKTHDATRQEIEVHRLAVKTALAYEGPAIPGPHCRWCSAFSQCPIMSQDANFLMGSVSRDPENLTELELVRMLRIIRAVGDLKGTLESELLSRIKSGEAVPGVEMVPRVTFRSWNNATEAARNLYEMHGPQGVKPVSPAQAEKLSAEAKKYAAVAAHKPEGELTLRY